MTESIATQRVQRELVESMEDGELNICAIKVTTTGDSLTHLYGEIGGPLGTPYEGGTFKVDIVLPDTYPFTPPKIKFLTRLWHPNISSSTGAICIDILKDKWVAGMTLRTVLLSLQALMSAPEPDDPQDSIVGQQYIEVQDIYDSTARYWTHVFANGPTENPVFDEYVAKMVEMGVKKEAAIVALSSANWDIEGAATFLFS